MVRHTCDTEAGRTTRSGAIPSMANRAKSASVPMSGASSELRRSASKPAQSGAGSMTDSRLIPHPPRGVQGRRAYIAACRRGARTSTCCPADGKILWGLQRSSGSNTERTSSMALKSSAVKINGISATFSTPMPCSPVRLPPSFDAFPEDLSPGRHHPFGLVVIAFVIEKDGMDIAVAGVEDVADAEVVGFADGGDAFHDLRQAVGRHHTPPSWQQKLGASRPSAPNARLRHFHSASRSLASRATRTSVAPWASQTSRILAAAPSRPALEAVHLRDQHRTGFTREAEVEGILPSPPPG